MSYLSANTCDQILHADIELLWLDEKCPVNLGQHQFSTTQENHNSVNTIVFQSNLHYSRTHACSHAHHTHAHTPHARPDHRSTNRHADQQTDSQTDRDDLHAAVHMCRHSAVVGACDGEDELVRDVGERQLILHLLVGG